MVVIGMVVATVIVGATAEVGGNVDVATVTGVVAVLGVVAVVGGSAKVDAAASDAGDDPSASFGAPDPVHAPTAAVATRQILITFSIDVTYPTLVRPAGKRGNWHDCHTSYVHQTVGGDKRGAARSDERGPNMTASPVMYPVHSFTFQPGH